MLADWENIAAATEPGSFNVRLADSDHPLPFRIGRDSRSRYVFQLDVEGGPNFGPHVPKLTGIDCVVEEHQGDQLRLLLTLNQQSNLRNFRLICTGLMLATETVDKSQQERGLLMVLDELHRWQEMLRLRRDKLLSRSEIIGLIGELLFLRDVLHPRIGMLSAIGCWNGPEGHEQDFVLGGTIFEVKTQVVTSDRRIRISSEDQLDPVQGRIIVCNQGIAPLPVGDLNARTLNGLVAEMRSLAAMAGARAGDHLDIALLRVGYETRDEYDEEPMLLVDRAFYDVIESFPRIERRDLRFGVEMVSYSIRVSDCQPFTVNIDETMEALLP
jgi:Putative  PD-(D/E)XK family member, (DUF4420)